MAQSQEQRVREFELQQQVVENNPTMPRLTQRYGSPNKGMREAGHKPGSSLRTVKSVPSDLVYHFGA